MARLSKELRQVFFDPDHPPQVTLLEILKLAGERTFGFLFVLLSLPSALPIPAPGYSIPFGIVILILAVQLAVGRRRPWLPEKLKQQTVKLQQVQKFLNSGLPWLQRIELLSRPRLSFVCTSSPGRAVLGTAIALMALSMMIPLPLTNTLPAVGVFITGFGLVDDDGAISLGGLGVCLIAAILSTALITAFIIGGTSLVEVLIEQIRSWKP